MNSFPLCTPTITLPIGSTQRGYLNKHVRSFMKGLSPKVYNALITFQSQIGTPEDGMAQEKLSHYKHAGRMIPIFCKCQCDPGDVRSVDGGGGDERV
jgi:hypothetical protein